VRPDQLCETSPLEQLMRSSCLRCIRTRRARRIFQPTSQQSQTLLAGSLFGSEMRQHYWSFGSLPIHQGFTQITRCPSILKMPALQRHTCQRRGNRRALPKQHSTALYLEEPTISAWRPCQRDRSRNQQLHSIGPFPCGPTMLHLTHCQ